MYRLRSLTALIATLLALALVAVACADESGDDGNGGGDAADDADGEDDGGEVGLDPDNPTDLQFQLNWTWYPADHSYFQVGLDEGIYADHGLNLDVQESDGSQTTLTLVGTGDAPVGYVDAATIMRGLEQDLPVTVIGVVNQLSPMAAIFKAERGYEEIADLEGSTVAVTTGDALTQIFPAVLGASGMSEDDVELASTSDPGAKEVAVLQDNADAMLAFYTEQAPRIEANQGVDMDWISFADAGVNTLNLAIVANDAWLEDNPDVAEAFIAATQEAIATTVDDPQGAAEQFSEAHPDFDVELGVGQIEESVELLQTERSEGEPYLWTAEEDWMETYGLLQDYADLGDIDDIEQRLTNEFVQQR